MASRKSSEDFIIDNPIGSTVNDWTIIDEPILVQYKRNRESNVLCKCKCGKEKLVRIRDIKNNKTKQCKGCARKLIRKIRPNPVLENDYALIPLQGKHNNKNIIIDLEDVDIVNNYMWYGSKSSNGKSIYARTNINEKKWNVTQFIFNNKKNIYDHIDGDPLNNRKTNLRLCSNIENARNRTKSQTKIYSSNYIGVCRIKAGWRACVWKNGKTLWQKSFKTEVEAAEARDKKATEVYGEFAKINFPERSNDVS